ncbi:hypothetical protein CXF34_03955, partial [Corynebacterium bovis]
MRTMSLATVFVAVAGYLVIWVSDKALGADGKEAFMVYWGLFFALASTTPAVDIQHACGTGLTAAVTVADAIRLGRFEAGVAGGV